MSNQFSRILHGESGRRHAFELITEADLKKPHLLTLEPITTTKLQMRLDGLWRGVVSKDTGQDREDIRAYNKLYFGVPILIEKADEFAEAWQRDVDHKPESEKLQFVRAFNIPVTRRFNTREYTVYLKDVELFYNQQGIRLPHPDDYYWRAMGVRR